MHFDQRTQRALREAGVDPDDVETAAEVARTETDDVAAELAEFFERHEVVYSTMDLAHTSGDRPKHAVEYVDLYTHGAEIRGWLRFDTWGVYVEDGRVFDDDLVELTLGPTVHDRVRFAPERDRL